MSIHDQWGSEKASDWEVTPSKVKLEPVTKAVKKSTAEDEKAFNIFKTDDDKRLVFGWASISIDIAGEQLEDRQQDMIDPEDLEEAAYDYVLNFRDTGEEHIPTMRKKGKLVESCVFTAEKQKAMGITEGILPIGWWIGFKIEDDAAWEKVKNGTYKMFSIEGKANREPVEKAAEKHLETKKKEEAKAVAKTFNDVLGAPRAIAKNSPERFDTIYEVQKTDACDVIYEIEKFNPYHDSKGRFASAHGATSFTYAPGKSKAHDNAIARHKELQEKEAERRASRNYGMTGTKDVVAQINKPERYDIDGKKNSLHGFLDENGNLTPEREAVHKEIIDKLLYGKEPVDGAGHMTILGGGPASGKSSVLNPDTTNDKHATTIDPDMIKSLLPGYGEMAKVSDKAADFFHEESSALAKRLAEVAINENLNLIYDGTGDGSTGSVGKKIDQARAKGYRVDGKYVTIDTEEAVRRNQKRYDDAQAKGEIPRLPPEDRVRSTHAKVTDISVAMADKFDSIEIWDNNGARGQQKLVATGGNGQGLKAVPGQERAFNDYLSKSLHGIEGFITLPNGTVINTFNPDDD